MIFELPNSLGLLRGQEVFFLASKSMDNNGTRITVLKTVTGGYSKGIGTEISVDLISTKLWKAEDN